MNLPLNLYVLVLCCFWTAALWPNVLLKVPRSSLLVISVLYLSPRLFAVGPGLNRYMCSSLLSSPCCCAMLRCCCYCCCVLCCTLCRFLLI